ncbi:MAG TPA: glycosyltransferase family 39 protein, partial [Gaiellaceae bacterium]|nr:glycosyltransferase family 39 protein [Gaiellaceae bacterium]
MDVVAFLAGSGAIAASAGLGAACLRLRSVWSFALAWYVLAFAEVLALCLVLSLGGMLGRPGLLVGAALLSCGSAWLWRRSGSPRPPTPALCRDARRTGPGPLVLLAGAVAFALAYVAALALGTPPSGWDQLTYHLARAAFWLQAGRVGYIGDAYDERLNYNPPGAEMAFAFVLALGRSERLPALVQLVAALACAGGVYGLARLLGLSRREAAFGALAFLATPIVLLQAATPKNDLVVASFLVAAALFLLSGAKAELVLAGIATALAVTTKVTAAYGIAVLLALAIVASPHSARKRRVATLALGTALGSGWYVINLAETGRLGGDQSQFPGMSAVGEPAANLLAASGLLLDLADAPGAEGADVAVYPLAALLVAGLLLARSVRRPAFSREREAPFVPLLVAASPFAALAASELGWPAFLSL